MLLDTPEDICQLLLVDGLHHDVDRFLQADDRATCQELIDRSGSQPTGPNRPHCQIGAQDRISTGKHTRAAGLESPRVDGDSPTRHFQPRILRQIDLDPLTDGCDHGVAAVGLLRTGDRHRSSAARAIGLAQFHPLADHLDLATLQALETQRRHQVLDLHTFLFRPLDFLHQARHLSAGASIHHLDLSTQTQRGSGSIHRRVATAHDHHARAEVGCLASGDPRQDIDAMSGKLLSLAAQALRQLSADSQKHRVVRGQQIVDREVHTQPLPHTEVGSHLAHHRNLVVQGLARKPVGRDPVAEHAPRLLVGIIDGHPVSLLSQIEGGGETRWTGAHDSDLFGSILACLGRLPISGRSIPIGNPAMQLADRETFIVMATAAMLLTESRANPTQGSGHGQPIQ